MDYFIMHFEKINQFYNLEFSYICKNSGGYISRNHNIFENIILNSLNQFILNKAVFGTPIFKLGEGNKNLLILAGTHGNELSSQVAALDLINKLLTKDLNNTIYVVPFLAPKSTMDNLRHYDEMDLNRSAHIKGSLSCCLLDVIKELKIDYVGDFHTTALNSNPGIEAVFCSKQPSLESYLIASYISNSVCCELIPYDFAGETYTGAIEDVCNLNNIPSITGEVLSPFGEVAKGSIRRSFLQMNSFLEYFGD